MTSVQPYGARRAKPRLAWMPFFRDVPLSQNNSGSAISQSVCISTTRRFRLAGRGSGSLRFDYAALLFSSLLFSSFLETRCALWWKKGRLSQRLAARSIFLSSVRRTWRDRSLIARMPRSYANTATSFPWINADRHRAVARSTSSFVAGRHYRAHQDAQHENPCSFVSSFAHLYKREYKFS